GRADASHRNPVVGVALVEIKKILLIKPIGHEQIQEAIVVVVAPGNPVGISSLTDNRAGGNLRERSVAIVMIKKIFPQPVAHKQVQIPIVVIVRPRGTDRVTSVIYNVPSRD